MSNEDKLFNDLKSSGLTTNASEDYGSLASSEPPTRAIQALCSSDQCCSTDGQRYTASQLKPVGNRRPFACPDCGHALFYKTTLSHKREAS